MDFSLGFLSCPLIYISVLVVPVLQLCSIDWNHGAWSLQIHFSFSGLHWLSRVICAFIKKFLNFCSRGILFFNHEVISAEMPHIIVSEILRYYRRGNDCEALIWVPSESIVCFIAKRGPLSQGCFVFSAVGAWQYEYNWPLQWHSAALLHQTTRGQPGWYPLCFVCSRQSSPLGKSVFAIDR